MDRGVMNPGTARRRITVDEYYRMAEEGLLAPDSRTELIDGEIITMPPVGTLHFARTGYGSQQLMMATLGRATVVSQSTLRLDDYFAPEPDILVLKYREDFYESRAATPADVLLLVEVSDSSITYDRKIKAPLYARAKIPECWIFDLKASCLEIYRDPSNGEYRSIEVIHRPDAVSIHLVPDVKIDLARFFSPTST